MKTVILIVICLIAYDIVKPRVVSLFFKYISGRKIYWDNENKTLYYFIPSFPEMYWRCESGISKPIVSF